MIHVVSICVGGIPALLLRGRLKHSWLENEVLNKAPETVSFLRRQAGWPALSGFQSNAQQAISFASELEAGFSPSQLVDTCAPLLALPESDRLEIREAVHAAYLACFDTAPLACELRAAGRTMQAALAAMIEEWNSPDESIDDSALQTKWREVLGAAERLRDALDKLPKGIVLP